MKQVEIIEGTYGYKPAGAGHIRPVSIGGTVCVEDKEAERLVALGVAAYVEEAEPIPPVATTHSEAPEEQPGENMPDEQSDAENETIGQIAHGTLEVEDTVDIVNGHFTVESLLTLTRSNMESLAADLSVDVSKCKNKSEIAEILAAIEVKADEDSATDEDGPPSLGAEPPVL